MPELRGMGMRGKNVANLLSKACVIQLITLYRMALDLKIYFWS